MAELRYRAYDETRYTYETTPTSFRYTGQRQEESLGLYRMGARWVDPALSRWLSADTLVPNPSNSQSFNRYSWVRNNPLKYIDSTGHREEGECGFSGEACPGDEPPPPPQPTPSQPIPDPPFWDIDRGAVRHLVESCGPLECSAAVFNAYTPGGWDFHIADEWHTATSEVYNVGPVSEADALEAAREGHPNPLSNEQMNRGIRQRLNPDFNAEYHLIMWVRPWLPYQYLFDRLGWDNGEKFALHNFEPRYLTELVVTHQAEVEQAYTKFLWEYKQDPDGFIDKLNIFKWSGSRR